MLFSSVRGKSLRDFPPTTCATSRSAAKLLRNFAANRLVLGEVFLEKKNLTFIQF
jgi:hypothetical protein